MRLIDVDQFKAKLLSFMDRKSTTPSDTDCILDGVINLLEEQPTETSESWVKHGHWVHVDELPSGDYFKCSECNHHIFLKSEWKVSSESPADEYRYCSGCGARMDGDAND